MVTRGRWEGGWDKWVIPLDFEKNKNNNHKGNSDELRYICRKANTPQAPCQALRVKGEG